MRGLGRGVRVVVVVVGVAVVEEVVVERGVRVGVGGIEGFVVEGWFLRFVVFVSGAGLAGKGEKAEWDQSLPIIAAAVVAAVVGHCVFANSIFIAVLEVREGRG